MRISILILVISIGIPACKDRNVNQGDNVICIPASLQDGLIAAYTFGGGSLNDATLSGNNLTKSGPATPAADRGGNTNCAYQFVNAGNLPSFLATSQTGFLNGLSDFSVSIWYKPTGARGGGDFEVILSRGSQGHCPDRRGEWSVGLYDCRRAVFGHDNSVWADFTTPFLDTHCQDEMNNLTDKWHHVVAVRQGNAFKIYFDGVLNGTATGAANCGNNTYQAQDTGDLFFGTDFNGSIDDVLVYNRALSDQEVILLFGLEPCCE
ncbi:MAG: hypothetical protein RJA20_1796 [Bacteroidota bacterium]|jgi:hypothetical protein